MFKAKITAIENYYGKHTISAQSYIDHFKQLGIDSTSLTLKVFGRENLSVADSKTENSLTMAKTVTHKALDALNLKGSDINLIVYSSIMGEYLAPPVSTILHKEIGGDQHTQCYDINVNCIGMTVALEHIMKYMSVSPHIQRALLVGSEFLTATVNEADPTAYGVFGDGACAVIIEQTNEECGLLASRSSVFDYLTDHLVYPPCGMNKIMQPETVIKPEEMYMTIQSFDGNWGEHAIQDIKETLKEANLTAEDIALFCVSQLSKTNITMLKEAFQIPDEKIPQISLQHGYTGTSSPFMVLYEGLKQGKVKRGDYLLFWTIGGGVQTIATIIQY